MGGIFQGLFPFDNEGGGGNAGTGGLVYLGDWNPNGSPVQTPAAPLAPFTGCSVSNPTPSQSLAIPDAVLPDIFNGFGIRGFYLSSTNVTKSPPDFMEARITIPDTAGLSGGAFGNIAYILIAVHDANVSAQQLVGYVLGADTPVEDAALFGAVKEGGNYGAAFISYPSNTSVNAANNPNLTGQNIVFRLSPNGSILVTNATSNEVLFDIANAINLANIASNLVVSLIYITDNAAAPFVNIDFDFSHGTNPFIDFQDSIAPPPLPAANLGGIVRVTAPVTYNGKPLKTNDYAMFYDGINSVITIRDGLSASEVETIVDSVVSEELQAPDGSIYTAIVSLFGAGQPLNTLVNNLVAAYIQNNPTDDAILNEFLSNGLILDIVGSFNPILAQNASNSGWYLVGAGGFNSQFNEGVLVRTFDNVTWQPLSVPNFTHAKLLTPTNRRTVLVFDPQNTIRPLSLQSIAATEVLPSTWKEVVLGGTAAVAGSRFTAAGIINASTLNDDVIELVGSGDFTVNYDLHEFLSAIGYDNRNYGRPFANYARGTVRYQCQTKQTHNLTLSFGYGNNVTGVNSAQSTQMQYVFDPALAVLFDNGNSGAIRTAIAEAGEIIVDWVKIRNVVYIDIKTRLDNLNVAEPPFTAFFNVTNLSASMVNFTGTNMKVPNWVERLNIQISAPASSVFISAPTRGQSLFTIAFGVDWPNGAVLPDGSTVTPVIGSVYTFRRYQYNGTYYRV